MGYDPGIDVGLPRVAAAPFPACTTSLSPPDWAGQGNRPGYSLVWRTGRNLSVIPDPTFREAAMSTTEDRASGELRDGYAEIGDQRLHYVEAGEGPLIVLLHGFPEFWYGWRQQIQAARGGGIPGRRT